MSAWRGETRELELAGLATAQLGRASAWLDRASSSNDIAWAWALEGAPHGALVAVGAQEQGRGRQGRRWSSPAGGNLYASLVLHPSRPLADMAAFALAAGLACAEALEALAPGHTVRLKWPNDLLLDGRKLGGLLLESRLAPAPLVVLGLGINLVEPADGWPRELAGRAAALPAGDGGVPTVEATLLELLPALEASWQLYEERGLAPFLPGLAARDALADREVEAEMGGERLRGRAGGIGADGALLLRLPSGERRALHAGEVHLVGG